jgi:hypothetical protein
MFLSKGRLPGHKTRTSASSIRSSVTRYKTNQITVRPISMCSKGLRQEFGPS